MAATVVLCKRTGSKSSKINMPNVNLKSKVRDFRSKASRLLDLPVHEIELVYCGQLFHDECCLDMYGIRAGSIVHVLKKAGGEQQEEIPEPMDSASVQQVVTALQAALLNSTHRNSVERMMSRPDTIENLVAATPGLAKDPVALAMLQDPELLAILADPDHIHKVIAAHPCLGHAAMMVAAAINEETASSMESTSSAPGTYSLDQMSDDEDMDSVLRGQAQPITASQLAAALASAGGGANQSGSSGSSTSASQGITSDFLRQAMLHASGGGTSTTQGSGVSEVALQQLRDMGITDEAQARQALQVTGGDIQAALELLFGDNS